MAMPGMNSLNDTTWDVLISGTGVTQSLLALALSRSGKRVLHIDQHEFYGGPEAAFSLQEAEDWVNSVNKEPTVFPFESASIWRSPSAGENHSEKLSFSRAYTLSLSPQLVYNRSKLLPSLVSSRVYRQLEFQAIGNWWIFRGASDAMESAESQLPCSMQRVPSTREDIFADDSLSMKSKRSLIKFLKYLNQSDHGEQPEENLDIPFSDFLRQKFQISQELIDPLFSLCLSPHPSPHTMASYALPKIKRHIQSIGIFGQGFSSVIAKWGGGSEIAQVACRVCAVGGGVYALGKKIRSVNNSPSSEHSKLLSICLESGEVVRTNYLAGSSWDFPTSLKIPQHSNLVKVSRSMMIVLSSLENFFPPTSEDGPVAAATVVFSPGNENTNKEQIEEPPLYLVLHSSDTGECPSGQCVIYGSVLGTSGHSRIHSAVDRLLHSAQPGSQILWKMDFTQLGWLGQENPANIGPATSSQILLFPPPCLDLEFNDSILDQVQDAWRKIMGDSADEHEFLVFEDREATEDEDL